jgi:hypothetical protein
MGLRKAAGGGGLLRSDREGETTAGACVRIQAVEQLPGGRFPGAGCSHGPAGPPWLRGGASVGAPGDHGRRPVLGGGTGGDRGDHHRDALT